jgi:hypothetical protein
MWRGPGETFQPARLAMFRPFVRLGLDARVAVPGDLPALEQLLFLPAVDGRTVTVESIEIARFEITPIDE